MAQARVTEQWREQIEKGQMPAKVFKTYVPESVVGSEEGGIRKAAFVVSTGDEDRDGDIVNPSGWMLDNYRKNPVVLWAHDVKSLPIARAESIGVEGGKLKSVTIFPQKGVYPFADQVFGLVSGGFLKGTSVGFHPVEAAPRKGKSKGVQFDRQELYEYSILPIPSNREALVEAKAAGHDVQLVVKWAEDWLDYCEEQGIWVPKFKIQKALQAVLPLQVSVPAVPSVRAGAGSEGHATAGAELSDEEIKGLADFVSKDSEPEVAKRIRRDGDQWCVYSEDYSKKLGCHDTEEEAKAQLAAIEASKHGKSAPNGVTKEDDMDVIKGLADELFGGQSKEAPPWMKQDSEDPKPSADGTVDPQEAADAAKDAAKEQNAAVEDADKGETPSAPSAPGQGAAGQDALFAGLMSEIEPLKAGGSDPTQVATALKAALEKFAAAFMQTYVVPGGAPAPGSQQAQTPAPPPPPPPPADAQASAAPPPPPGEEPKRPPFPQKGVSIEFDGVSYSESDLREIIEKSVRSNVEKARMHLTGKLPG